jgi:succinate dehydrogenase/fumarate reductase flavoprotein subunit
LGAIRCRSTVFGRRAGAVRRQVRQREPSGVDAQRAESSGQKALTPFERVRQREARIKVQEDLQESMQALVGIGATRAR